MADVSLRDRVMAAYKGGYADRMPAYPIAARSRMFDVTSNCAAHT